VAAGLTIFGHDVSLVFTGDVLSDSDYQSEQAELLDLADIEPTTTLVAMKEQLRVLNPEDLCSLIVNSDTVINV